MRFLATEAVVAENSRMTYLYGSIYFEPPVIL